MSAGHAEDCPCWCCRHRAFNAAITLQNLLNGHIPVNVHNGLESTDVEARAGRWRMLFVPATWTPRSPLPWRTNGLDPRTGSVVYCVACSWRSPLASCGDITQVRLRITAARTLRHHQILMPRQRFRGRPKDKQGNMLSCMARGLSGRV